MQGKRTPSRYEPVLLIDPKMDRAASLARQLELIGFPTRTGVPGPRRWRLSKATTMLL
jgi:hypothetical protein